MIIYACLSILILCAAILGVSSAKMGDDGDDEQGHAGECEADQRAVTRVEHNGNHFEF